MIPIRDQNRSDIDTREKKLECARLQGSGEKNWNSLFFTRAFSKKLPGTGKERRVKRKKKKLIPRVLTKCGSSCTRLINSSRSSRVIQRNHAPENIYT